MGFDVSCLLEAVGHQQQGFPERAEAIYRAVIAECPEQPNALYLYGLLQLKAGRVAEAADMLERAAILREDPEVWIHLARARLAVGEYEAALRAAAGAQVRGAPRSELLYVQGTAETGCGRPEKAVVALLEAAGRAPEHAAIRLNLGNAMADLDRLEEAKGHVQAAAMLDPGLVEAHVSLGYLLARMGQLDEACAACERALMIDPNSGEAHWNLATAMLLKGDYRGGFAECEWRKRHVQFRRFFIELPGPVWTGFPLQGLTLLVLAEQGIGDTIQLARFFPVLAQAGARIILATCPALIPLMKSQSGLSSVVSRHEPLPQYDCWVDQMSLPHVLGSTIYDLPGAGGYLVADGAKRRVWAERSPNARIGFVWAGNPSHSNDRRRSMRWTDLLPITGAGAISLQVGPNSGDAACLGLSDVSREMTDYAETAAIVANLELVITVDTSVAHLAGALGVPAFVMLPHAPDWRWMLGRDDTPWYDSVRLFRQDEPGNWAGVVGQVSAALKSTISQAA